MQHRISPWELCSAGTVAFGIIPHTRWLCRKWYPVSGEAGYGSDYSWAITSKAIACAFTIGCSTGKKGPDNYFFMIMPSWWMWMIIAIQGEREFFFCVCVKWKPEAVTEQSLLTENTSLVTYIQKTHPQLLLWKRGRGGGWLCTSMLRDEKCAGRKASGVWHWAC